jgi:acetyl-CoA carboxylase carboxyl transferase subunit alpha
MPSSEAELRLRERLSRLRNLRLLGGARLSGELERLQRQLDRISAEPSDEDIWRSVELARHEERPYVLDYVERMLEDFVELHGDRARAEDPALVAGIGRFRGRTVAFIGTQKGRDIHERTKRNFGMTHPEGYRKAMRMMEIAERHRFPLISLIDTPGAYPGVAAEQHGQGGAIARSQALMARLTVPIAACIIGEGSSGGAVAIGLADRVLMQENAIYVVISPEGCAAILWRDAGEREKAAAAFRPDAVHCLELGIIDAIVPEPEGGAHTDYDAAAQLLATSLEASLHELRDIDGPELRRRRRKRYRALGVFAEAVAESPKDGAFDGDRAKSHIP